MYLKKTKIHISFIENSLNELFLQSADSDEETNGLNAKDKVSLTEFQQQYRELSAWLTQVLQVTKKAMGTQVLSEKYLSQVSPIQQET